VSLTPAVREFLVRLDELLDAKAPAGLDRAAVAVTTADSVALVRLPHSSDHARDVELEVDDATVIVRYTPEQIVFTSRDEALRFVEMLCDGRVEVGGIRNLLWTTICSYRDGQTVPFRRTRMPWPSLRLGTDRHPVGFGD